MTFTYAQVIELAQRWTPAERLAELRGLPVALLRAELDHHAASMGIACTVDGLASHDVRDRVRELVSERDGLRSGRDDKDGRIAELEAELGRAYELIRTKGLMA